MTCALDRPSILRVLPGMFALHTVTAVADLALETEAAELDERGDPLMSTAMQSECGRDSRVPFEQQCERLRARGRRYRSVSGHPSQVLILNSRARSSMLTTRKRDTVRRQRAVVMPAARFSVRLAPCPGVGLCGLHQFAAGRDVLLVDYMFLQTLGTALSDGSADTAGLGYIGAAILFSVLLAVVAGACYWTVILRTVLFWTASILTRPLGAVLGDFLDRNAQGGLALDRLFVSALLLLFIVVVIVVFPQRAARRAH